MACVTPHGPASALGHVVGNVCGAWLPGLNSDAMRPVTVTTAAVMNTASRPEGTLGDQVREERLAGQHMEPFTPVLQRARRAAATYNNNSSAMGYEASVVAPQPRATAHRWGAIPSWRGERC